ncbi:MAG: HDIG domain-containing protein [Desulfotignum sp.]|nr:HDIG domain-containing protein [Desulfotignum sp.]
MKKTKFNIWLDTITHFVLSTPYLLWFMLLGITLLFTFFQTPEQQQINYDYKIGDVAQRDIKAPRDLLVEDREVSEERRSQARDTVRIVYDLDADLLPRIQASIEAAMTIGRSLFEPEATRNSDGATPAEQSPEPTFTMVLETKSLFEEKLGIPISEGAYSILYKHRFDPDITRKIQTIMEKVLSNGVVANKEILLEQEHKGIVLRNIKSNEERVINNLKVFYGPDQAKAMVRIEGEPLLKKVNYNLTNLIVDICQRLLQPNIFMNKNETQARILSAQGTINPVMYQIKAGEMVVREGERIDKTRLIKLTALQEQTVVKTIYVSATGIALITFTLLLVSYLLFFRHHTALEKDHNKHMLFLALGLILYLGIVKLSTYLVQSADPTQAWDLGSASFFMAIPLPAAAMICCLFLGFTIAVYFSLVLSVLASISFGGSFEAFIFFLLSCSMAAFWAQARQTRKNFIMAGVKLAIFNSFLAVALGFYSLSQPDPMILAREVLIAFCGGLFSAVLTIGFCPLIELVFDYTTEAKLLELANLDQPLIKKLMIEAPGTYNHSVIVATLAEAAASAIHANSLKAKVMAYYHDIGKLDKIMYFIENQADGKNRHDKLSPSMSALILIQHVKKGVELAKTHKLGDEIIEGITQHHGTSLIKFFYNKALKSGKENINEENFRYPGPKPQTRETGIVMLADVVEAAVRALDRPTPSRIRGRVKELINDIFADGQLEECELTLKDLHQIAKSFNNILTSIYHSRIEYTDKPQEKKKEKHDSASDIDRQPSKTNGVHPSSAQKDRTDLKRLGL